MAELVLTDASILMGVYDITGHTNSVAVEYGADVMDSTVFGSDTHLNLGGLKTTSLAIDGYCSGAPDSELHTNVGGTDIPFVITPEAKADGGRAFAMVGTVAEYTKGCNVGEIVTFSASAQCSGHGLVRGIIEDTGTVSSTSDSTGTQLGAVSASQKLIAIVVCESGTCDIDLDVESDDNGSFTSPTIQASATTITGAGYEVIAIDGAITDDYWRVSYTVTSGSANITVFLGII